MSEARAPCARFSHIDPLAYLVDGEAEEFAEWKAHFPECSECSAALADWSALEWQLGEMGDAHPEAPELNAFALGHGLDDAQRARIDAHVAGCPMCSDQLRALERFEAGTAAAQLQSDEAEEGGLAASLIESIRRLLQPVPTPVWAGAIVLLLFAAYSLVNGVGPAPEGDSTRAPQMAQQDQGVDEEPILALPETPAPPRIETLPPSESLAERDSGSTRTEAPGPLPDRIDQPEEAPAIDGGALAEVPVPAPEVLGTEGTERATEAPAELLIASLDLPTVLAYHGGGAGRGRLDMLGRGSASSAEEGPPLQLLAPKDGRGRAVATAGVLVWSIPRERRESVRLTIVDDRQIDPVFEKRIEGPQSAGLHGLDLASHGIELEKGIDYVWSVALEVDLDRPSRSPRSQAVLELVASDDAAAARLARAGPEGRIEAALSNGLWYDAVSDLARAAASPRADANEFAAALRELAVEQGIAVSTAATVTLHGP